MAGDASTGMLYEPLGRDEVVAAGNEAIWTLIELIHAKQSPLDQLHSMAQVLAELSPVEQGAIADGGAQGDPWLWGGLRTLPWSSRWRTPASDKARRRLR